MLGQNRFVLIIILRVKTDQPSGTLTKNEQTVTEAYAVDEFAVLDPTSSKFINGRLSPPLLKMLDIGSLCNNAQVTRNDDNAPVIVGQSTDVALLNVLGVFGLHDKRDVSGL